MTPDADRRRLLRLAREAILAHVNGLAPPRHEAGGVLDQPSGAFVTLHANGELRGCIGHVQPDQSLWQVVSECAVAASARDPRFPPVTGKEVAALQIEVSILGPLVPVASIEEIQIGRDGLVVERGWTRGLLLPQVAAEHAWDARTFVEQTCRKAGLASDAWSHGAKLWRFEAEVFGEN